MQTYLEVLACCDAPGKPECGLGIPRTSCDYRDLA